MSNILADKKNKPNKLVLKNDFVIKAGTTFECVDGTKREFVDGNYEALISTSKDTVMNVVVSEDELHNSQGVFVAADKVLDVEKAAEWIREKLSRGGIKTATLDKAAIVSILNLETEYMKENGIVEG